MASIGKCRMHSRATGHHNVPCVYQASRITLSARNPSPPCQGQGTRGACWHARCGHAKAHSPSAEHRRRVAVSAGDTGSEGSQHVGVVIVDHGSKRPASNDMLVEFGQLYQQVTGAAIVEIAHMEIAEPTIEQAVGKCIAAGATKVVIAPYFLSKGRHIQDDIPALVEEAKAKHGVECLIAGPIGVDPLMAQLIQNRVEAALQSTQVPA